MLTKKLGIILALFCGAVVFSGCGPSGGSNASNNQGSANTASNSNSVKTNSEELGMLINLPFESEEAIWKENSAAKKVIAVLRFEPSVSNTVVVQAEKFKPAQDASIPAETWFPPELIAQSEMNGDSNLKGKMYAANDFFQEPYTQGTLFRVEGTDYFVLQLSAK